MKLRRLKLRRPLRLRTLLLGASLLLALAGCGQKGPLYLPDHKPEAVPATPGQATPAPAMPDAPTQTPATRKAPPAPDPAAAR